MSYRPVSAKHLEAVRLIRTGLASDQVCRKLGLRSDQLRSVETAYQDIPDDILARLENALRANEKLRRLVAELAHTLYGNEKGKFELMS
jgi:hypothetical protein